MDELQDINSPLVSCKYNNLLRVILHGDSTWKSVFSKKNEMNYEELELTWNFELEIYYTRFILFTGSCFPLPSWIQSSNYRTVYIAPQEKML